MSLRPPRACFLLILASLVWAACSRAPQCAMCGRPECDNLAITVTRQDGTSERACCPRCGAHLVAATPGPVTVMVSDFGTGRALRAETAVYVEGSDVHPCRGLITDPPRDEHGCCLIATYDRCEPSVLAFGDRSAADTFIDVHGGTVATWSDLLPESP